MIFSSVLLADEVYGEQDWSSLSEVENAWDGQKMIKNSEYDAVVNELEKRKNAKKIRANKRAGQMFIKFAHTPFFGGGGGTQYGLQDLSSLTRE